MAKEFYRSPINPHVDIAGVTGYTPSTSELEYTDAAVILGDSAETRGPYVAAYLNISSSRRITSIGTSTHPGIRLIVGFTDSTFETLAEADLSSQAGNRWSELDNDLDTAGAAWFVIEGGPGGTRVDLDDFGIVAPRLGTNPSTSSTNSQVQRYQISAANRGKTIDWVDIYHDLGTGQSNTRTFVQSTRNLNIAVPNASPTTDGDTGSLTIARTAYLYVPASGNTAPYVGLFLKLNNSGTSRQTPGDGGFRVTAVYTTGSDVVLAEVPTRLATSPYPNTISYSPGDTWVEFERTVGVRVRADTILTAPSASTTLTTNERFALDANRTLQNIKFEYDTSIV